MKVQAGHVPLLIVMHRSVLLHLSTSLAGNVVITTADASPVKLPVVMIAHSAVPLESGHGVINVSPFGVPHGVVRAGDSRWIEVITHVQDEFDFPGCVLAGRDNTPHLIGQLALASAVCQSPFNSPIITPSVVLFVPPMGAMPPFIQIAPIANRNERCDRLRHAWGCRRTRWSRRRR